MQLMRQLTIQTHVRVTILHLDDRVEMPQAMMKLVVIGVEPALDQKRGQALEPKLIKPTWEKDFDQLRGSDRTARVPDYRD